MLFYFISTDKNTAPSLLHKNNNHMKNNYNFYKYTPFSLSFLNYTMQ